MEAHDRELGPIDIVVIGYPVGSPMTGEALPLLMDIVERGIIRILDVMFVVKDEHGMFTGFEAKELDDKHVGDFKIFEGASSGILGHSDVENAAAALEPGEGAAVIVYENTWAAAFAGAVRRNGGVLIGSQRVSPEDLLEALEAAEAQTV
jgi:Family of unknown function (DUF6325)